MTVTDVDVVGAFEEAADAFVQLVRTVEAGRLGAPAVPGWTVAQLIGHTDRAFVATEAVLAAPVEPASRRLGGAAEYYRVAMSSVGVHEGIGSRARAAAADLGDAPFDRVRADADRVAALVASVPLDREVQHAAGRLAFGEYLRTRVTELVLHTVDLELALGVGPAAPSGAARLVAGLMVELSDWADPLAVACALAGRALPSGCNVLA
jgi:uncharacterized protein (TIGR03083 family)